MKDLSDDDYQNEDKIRELFAAAYNQTDEKMKVPTLKPVIDFSQDSVPAAGACVVTAFIRVVGDKRMLFVANAGDSRAILSENGAAIRLTHDHKPESCPDDVERLLGLTPPGFVDPSGRVNGL